jgi:uncharacterized protein YkwD
MVGRTWQLTLWLAVLALGVACKPPPDAQFFYTSVEPGPVRGDRSARLVLGEIERLIRSASSPSLVGDGRLADIALELAQSATSESEALDGTTLALMTRARGLVNPLPQVVFARAQDLETAGEALLKKAASWIAEFESTHYGIAATRRREGWAAVLVLDTRPIDLAPIPVALEEPGRIEIHLRLHNELVHPKLIITQPDGSVETPESVDEGRRLNMTLPLSKGLWGLEIMGTGVHGPTVVANMGIAVDAELPRDPPRLNGKALNTKGVADELLKLIARDRKAHGLSALTYSPDLARVALAHSQDMQQSHFFGHISPSAGGPQERAAQNHVPAWNVRENIARGYSAEEIHTLLMLSPAHRAAILSPHVDELGIGVTKEPEEDRHAFFVTELFAHAPVQLEPEAASQALLSRIDQLRKERGLSPITRSDSFDRAAMRAATEYFSRPKADAETILITGVRSITEPPGTHLIFASMFLDVEALALPLSSEMLDPKARFIGIAVAQGDDPRLGPGGVVWAVVVAR